MEGLLDLGRLVHASEPDVALNQDPRRNPQTGAIISKIEEILVANIDALKEARVLTIPLRSRRTGRVQRVRFPSARDTEAKKFSRFIEIGRQKLFFPVVGLLVSLSCSPSSCHSSNSSFIARGSRRRHCYHKEVCRLILFYYQVDTNLNTIDQRIHRAIYYQNPELFGSQRYVDELVNDIAFTFGLGRDALNIVATSKGLVAGALSITINNGSTLYGNPDDGQGALLPDIRAILSVNLVAINWLLVIEKEATFRGLVASRFHENARVGPGVLVTAKGYPDLSTRQFLHKVHTSFPVLPMYGLVDFDPDGVRIMLTYKNGSRSLQHEENATLNRLFWIGPRSNDILGGRLQGSISANVNQACVFSRTPSKQISGSQSSASVCPSGVFSPIDATLPLKAADRRLAVRLLYTTVGKDYQCIESQDFVRELQIMLMLNIKAEIQAVDDAGDLTTWLDGVLADRVNRV